MGEARGDEQLTAIGRRQLRSEPAPIRGRGWADIDDDIEDRAGRAAHQLVLLVRRGLIVKSSQGAPTRVIRHAALSQRRAQEEELRRSLREIRGAIDQYKRLVDAGHIERSVGDSGYPPSLQVLVEGLTDAMTPQATKIYILRSLPRDPFSPPDVTTAADTWALRSYASPPDDPQPGEDVFDVHSKSSATGLNGIAYKRW